MIRVICRGALIVLMASITVLSVVPPGMRPVTAPHHIEHLLIFAATGVVMALAFPWRLWLHVTTFALFTVVIEAVQLFAPGRHARFSDLAVNFLGACLGLAVGHFLARLSPAGGRFGEPSA
jgi:VanZ family protein